MDGYVWESAGFRALFEAIEQYDGIPLYQDTLIRWLRDYGASAKNRLEKFGIQHGSMIPTVLPEDLYELYALSRVNDTLLLSFQPHAVEGYGNSPQISPDEYISFMTAIGLRVAREASFSPFFHEIVTVKQDEDPNAPIALSREYWPALMLGNLMFSRAGVAVTGGREHIRKGIAEASVMYWAFRRRNRRCHDQSVGWGSNSQWSTPFRRDYHIGKDFYFNVDGKNDLSNSKQEVDEDGLAPHERLELLLHRCFIRSAEPKEYCFPYEDTYPCLILEASEGDGGGRVRVRTDELLISKVLLCTRVEEFADGSNGLEVCGQCGAAVRLTDTGQWYLFQHPSTPLACLSCVAEAIGGSRQECERKLVAVENLKQQAEDQYQQVFDSFSPGGGFSGVKELLFTAARIARELGILTDALATVSRYEHIGHVHDQSRF